MLAISFNKDSFSSILKSNCIISGNKFSSLIDLDNFSSRLLSKDEEMLFVVIGFSCEGTSSISIAASSFILEILILSSL
mgnify:CR=1 FL=1